MDLHGGSKRVPGLDGLRAISVGLVIFDHLCISGALPFRQTYIDFGNLGVRVFFLISGFIITSLLLDEKRSSGTVSLRAFYTRRVFRILPIFFVFLSVMTCAMLVVGRSPSVRDLSAVLLFNADYLTPSAIDLGHLWSLSVEEKFYIVWPVLIALCRRRTALGVAVTAVLLIPLVRTFAALRGTSYEQLLWPFHNAADALAMGCLLALVRSRLDASDRWMAVRRSRWLGILPVAIFALPAAHKLGPVYWLVGVTGLNLAVILAIDVLIAIPHSAIGRLLNSKLLVTVGSWSYGIYLWQQPLTFHRNTGLLGKFPIDVLVLMMLAGTGYYLVEKPAQAYGRRLARKVAEPLHQAVTA